MGLGEGNVLILARKDGRKVFGIFEDERLVLFFSLCSVDFCVAWLRFEKESGFSSSM
jgi:hypothetical protein